MTRAGPTVRARRRIRARNLIRTAVVASGFAVAIAVSWHRRSDRTDATPWPSRPVDLNAAGRAELTILPGVGPSLAAAIVSDREERGAFRSVEDLDRVRGIGPGLLARIRPYAVAGARTAADAPVTAYAAR